MENINNTEGILKGFHQIIAEKLFENPQQDMIQDKKSNENSPSEKSLGTKISEDEQEKNRLITCR